MKNLTTFDWLVLIFMNVFILLCTQFWLGADFNIPKGFDLIILVSIRFLTFSIFSIMTTLFYRFIYRKKVYVKTLAMKILVICLLTDLIGCLIFYYNMTL